MFEFKNAPNNIKSIVNPQADLKNVENGLEEANNNLTDELFNPTKKNIEEKIAEYIAGPTKNFINESYFLYNKSNLIKKTFVTTKTIATVWFFQLFFRKNNC